MNTNTLVLIYYLLSKDVKVQFMKIHFNEILSSFYFS